MSISDDGSSLRDIIIPDDISAIFHSVLKTAKIWTGLRAWFDARGYFIYPFITSEDPLPTDLLMYELGPGPASFPYAHVGSKNIFDRMRFHKMPSLWPAVSKEHQDVMIKILSTECDEVAILKYLMSGSQRSDPLNLTVPILDLFRFDHRYSFVVMPRWGPASYLEQTGFDCLGTALEYDNVLVNYYDEDPRLLLDYRLFFKSKQTKFVLCDFGLSVMFPPDTPPSARVCPAEESTWGTFEYHPPDVANGEAVYDPFAYDVACMGGVLCHVIGYMTPLAPPLAPFLDGMIIQDISSRYTAAEALEAYIRMMENLDPASLETPAPSPPPLPDYVWQAFDRWAGLPEEFVKEYSAHRPPVRPRRKVAQVDGTFYFVEWNSR
ncbi:unnamed protein product [Somion occarium]|uniref:Protein kinase domain-containing protein n=1 Tax=Somion occarium TaxID=3059160 RepID=A0ABP1CUA3_9APHY